MKQAHTIIYVTGLGDGVSDRNVAWQRRIIRCWRLWGVNAEIFQMKWADDEPFQYKIERLLARVDELDTRGHKISLVGVSAGASAALAAFVARKPIISGVVFICGKLAHPETVQQSYYDENPAFQAAMQQLNANLSKLNQADTQKLLSIHPLYDQTVRVRDTKIAGVRWRAIPTLLHVPSIALGITLFLPIGLLFLKKRAKIEL